MLNLNILAKPGKYGYLECEQCDGLGSMYIKEKFWFCQKCDGVGLLKDNNKVQLIKIKKKVSNKRKIYFN